MNEGFALFFSSSVVADVGEEGERRSGQGGAMEERYNNGDC